MDPGYNLRAALQRHDLQGEINPEGPSVTWKWEDLFTGEGFDTDVWQIEVVFSLAIAMADALQNDRGGMFVAAELLGEEIQKTAAWTVYWGSEESKAFREGSADPEGELLQTAKAQAQDLYNALFLGPQQKGLTLHIRQNAEENEDGSVTVVIS